MDVLIENLIVVGGVLVFMLFCGILLVALPLLVVWLLNTLFALGMPYTFHTWLAAYTLLVTPIFLAIPGR